MKNTSHNIPIRNQDSAISACRHCQNYVPQGRRGGQCRQLDVLVHGAWKACSLAIPPFSSRWHLDDVVLWTQESFEQEAIASPEDCDGSRLTHSPDRLTVNLT